MDLNAITSLISSIGFPIVACVYLYRANERLRETIDQLRDTIHSNTVAVEALKENLNVFERRKDG